jgi:TRAP-type C4-dicarboxylate transport system substrate-binding protein
MRAASALTSQIFLKILNADVIPLSFSDIIPSLQTGLINGGTTSPYMYLNAGIYEHAPHLTITNHALNPGIILINYDWFKYLSSLNQNSLLSSFSPSSVLRSDTRRQTCEAYSTLIKKGINIYTPNKNENKFWKNSVVKDHKKI